MRKYRFILKNLDCANCANKIQNKLSENENYKDVVVNFNTLRLSFESKLEYDEIRENIVKTIVSLEPEVEVLDVDKNSNYSVHHGSPEKILHNYVLEHSYENAHKNNEENKHSHDNENSNRENRKINNNLFRLVIGIILMIVGVYTNLPQNLNTIFIVLAYVVLLFRTTKNTLKLLKSKTIDEYFLVTISCIGAYLIGEKAEGLMVIILYELGKILEEKAINNSRKSISDLMNIRPEYANLKHNNHEHKVNPEEVNINDIIVIKQGEKVPLDGVVVSGTAYMNTSSLTGESSLRTVKENDEIISGSINEKGLVEVKVTERYENSTVSKILELVENATDKKAKTETFVNKASRIYTPVVVLLAILVALFLPLFPEVTYQESIYRALTFLIVSCPCAIVISVPLSYFSGIGKASKQGILIKGSNYLDALKNVKEIVFDKTGTLTKGEFGVEKIKSYNKNYNEQSVLEYAVLGERYSNHPIAVAILKAYGKELDNNIEDFEEVAGKGIKYTYNEKNIKVGNSDFVNIKPEKEIGTIIYVKVENDVIGCLILNDIVKAEGKDTIQFLNELGITTKMFTGDNKDISNKIAKELCISEVKSEMLPTDKYSELEKIIQKNKNTTKKVAFVGDGINDSPVLALSDIGISMGGVGASSAIEASDIVIMTDNLNKIGEAITISKITHNIIKQNLIFALVVKVAVLMLSIFGISQMWQAVFADVGVTIITILNTIRILKK